MENYNNIKEIIEANLDVKCYGEDCLFEDPLISETKKLLDQLETITYSNKFNCESTYIELFSSNLNEFLNLLNNFDKKLLYTIHKLNMNFFYKKDTIQYLMEVYKTHDSWRKRVFQTLDTLNDRDSLIKINTTKINSLFALNSSVNKMIFSGINLFEKHQVETAEEDFASSVILSSDKDIFISSKFNLYDFGVLRAICTLYESGLSSMTYKMILHALTGFKSRSPYQGQIDDIKYSINKMSMTEVTLYLKDPSKSAFYNDNVVKENLLYILFEDNNFVVNGQSSKSEGIRILREPILYRISKEYSKIEPLDATIIRAPISSTKKNIIIKEYMLHVIKLIELSTDNSEKDVSTEINLVTVYDDLNADTTQEKKKIRDTIVEILDYWVKIKYIKNYNLVKEKNKYNSIIIKI
ncbi:hypothetical protein [Peptostreptococcus faecalis]|uniref:hypothetical protein n=1 Tax=Peptostreptococcus faecalis TaxID=2045015 RepID=UPI000C7CEFFC|nr:hypothetical protein [Peptostreptococcus faecalis]